MSFGHGKRRALARCQGFLAVASDGPLGEVESLLFPGGRDEPDFMVVKTVDRLDQERRPLVPTQLVESIDLENGIVYFQGAAEDLAKLAESLESARGSAR